MDAVLDTNVVISALINPAGAPGRVLHGWRRRSFQWVSSEQLLLELSRALSYDKVLRRIGWSREQVSDFVKESRHTILITNPMRQLSVILDDPSDNRLLEAAIAGQAEYVVSGDGHLLAIASFEGVRVVTPSQFISILESVTRP